MRLWSGALWVVFIEKIDWCFMDVSGSKGVVQWLRVETRDREIRAQYPAPAVVSDLVVACQSS